jgi:hypothetical protein
MSHKQKPKQKTTYTDFFTKPELTAKLRQERHILAANA